MLNLKNILSLLTLLLAVAMNACESGSDYTHSLFGQTAFFSSTTVIPEGYFSVEFFWDLGDGTYSHIENPVHTYDYGNYEVCLKLIFSNNEESCEEEICKDLSLTFQVECEVEAGFGWAEIEEGLIQAEAFPTVGTFTSLESIHWELNGEMLSSEVSPQIDLPMGYHEVCLVAVGDAYGNGCESQMCEEIQGVALPEMQVDLHEHEINACDLRFQDVSELPEGATLVSRTWRVNGEEQLDSGVFLSHSFEAAGDHEVCLEVRWEIQGQEVSSTGCKMITSTCSEEEDKEWSVTGVQGQIVLSVSDRLTQDHSGPTNVQVYNLEGRSVFNTTVALNERNTLSDSFARGIYIVVLENDGEVQTQKVVIN